MKQPVITQANEDVKRNRIITLVFKILFFLIFFGFALYNTSSNNKLDGTGLALILIGAIPLLLPFLMQNFRSIELFGVKVELLERKLETQQIKISHQQKIINQLVVFSMAFYLYEMLKNFDECEKGHMKEYIFIKSDNFIHNLRFLRDNGYMHMNFKIAELTNGQNIAQLVQLTPIGKFYIRVRKRYEDKLRLAGVMPTNT